MVEKKNQQYVELLDELSPEDALPGVREFLASAQQLPSNTIFLAPWPQRQRTRLLSLIN